MRPVYLAGLSGSWDKCETPLESFTVVTNEPIAMMANIHTRMPVVLDDDGIETWLEPTSTPEQLRPLMKPAPERVITIDATESPQLKEKPRDDGHSLYG